jgi:hypothetical protein
MAHQHIVYMMMTDAAARAEDAVRIREYAPKLEELATRDDHRPYLAVAHRALGVAHRLAGEPVRAVERLNQAVEIFSQQDAGCSLANRSDVFPNGGGSSKPIRR